MAPDGIVTGRALAPEGSAYVPSTKSSVQPEDFTGRTLTGAVFPNNMGLNRSAVTAFGGFDERPALRHAEDNDFCYRWLRAGRVLRYEPETVVWHHDWRSPGQLVRTHSDYARSQGAFYAKHLYAKDWKILPLLGRELRGVVWRTLHSGTDRRPRWQRPEREVVPYLFVGMIDGWLESRRLGRQSAN
jgi:GT2 family glycosyltransferase